MDTDTIFTLTSIIFLIVFSAFFSGSETALTAVSRAKIHRLTKDGNKKAGVVERLRENKERLIGAILLGNNAVNIGASALATSLPIKYFGEEGVFFATIIMTLSVLIFAEVLPKTLAFRHPLVFALAVAPVMSMLVKILAPITTTIQMAVNAVIRLAGIRQLSADEVSESYDMDALRGAIDLSHHEGAVIKRERDMLGGILDLVNTDVQEIMIHRKNMVTINADEPPSEIIRKMLDSSHTRIPLWKDDADNIVGILHVKALLQAIRSHNGLANLDDLDIVSIASEPWFVPENTLLSDQLHAFRRKRLHFALVVDEYGALMGLVTLEDILEEIVGQIEDETDATFQQIKKQTDGSYTIHGGVTIRDINRQLDWTLPDESAHTIAGLLIHEAETLPEEGNEFVFFNRRFKVLKREGNQVTWLNIAIEAEAKTTED